MENVTSSYPFNYYVIFTLFLYTTIIPLAGLIVWYVCSWLDDGEKSYKYPSPLNLKIYSWCKKLNYSDPDIPMTFLVFFGGFCTYPAGIALAWLLQSQPMTVISFLSVLAVLFVAKALVRLAKKFNKHCKDTNAHK